MPQHIAKVDQVYWDRQIKVGETFNVDEGDVEVLCLLGRIDRQEAKEPVAQGTYATRDMTAQGKRRNRATA